VKTNQLMKAMGKHRGLETQNKKQRKGAEGGGRHPEELRSEPSLEGCGQVN
jgi:hypothetical protein